MHTEMKFGRPGSLEFVEQLNNIEVKIFDAPTIPQFRKAISVFMMNTWNDSLQYDHFSEADIDRCIYQLFNGEILPTGMEIVGICWGVSGMDLIDTTHLIRHRLFSFSAQAHGDRDMRDDRVVAKPGIMANEDFYDRYRAAVKMCHQLYMDMMDSGRVHGLDARTIMPRCFEHFYMVKCCIKDLIGYCKLRGDEQIQTTVDNVIAMKLWLEVLKLYPFLKPFVNFREQDHFYIKQCRQGKTNIFPPNAKNDVFEWNESQFYHPIGRDEFAGGEVYLELREKLLKEMDQI